MKTSNILIRLGAAGLLAISVGAYGAAAQGYGRGMMGGYGPGVASGDWQCPGPGGQGYGRMRGYGPGYGTRGDGGYGSGRRGGYGRGMMDW